LRRSVRSRIRQLEEEFASEHEAQRRHTTSPSPVAGGVKACGIVTDRRRRHGDAGIHTKAGRGMTPRSVLRTSLRWSAAGAWLAAAGYAAYVGVTWARYGHVAAPNPDEHDELLDRFMPGYDVVERHHIRVAAPAAATLAAAQDMILLDLPVVRAVFKGRALILGAAPDQRPRRGLLADSQSLGWVVLAETPGQEIVVGAVTKPWEANVTFRSLPGEASRRSASRTSSRLSGICAPMRSPRPPRSSAPRRVPSRPMPRHARSSGGIGPSCPRAFF
jgi:hypothetical protein